MAGHATFDRGEEGETRYTWRRACMHTRVGGRVVPQVTKDLLPLAAALFGGISDTCKAKLSQQKLCQDGHHCDNLGISHSRDHGLPYHGCPL